MGSRGNALFVVGVVIVFALVGIGYVMILGWEDGSTEEIVEPATSEDPAEGATLERADGVVEIRLGDQQWRSAEVGEKIAPGSGVRTGPEGAAKLAYGEGLAAEVRSGTSLSVDRLDSEVARFVVKEGLVIVDLDEKKQGKRIVQLAAEGSDAILETRGGRVTMLNDGHGNVQAAVTRGDAVLAAGGEQVTLGAGEQSSVASGEAPSAPVKIPSSLLLKVKWPPPQTAKRRHRISGNATPGSLVRVGKQIVAADADGRFTAVVDLSEGSNRLIVRAVDVVGRTEQNESPAIDLDTEAPPHEIETDPGMWRRGHQKAAKPHKKVSPKAGRKRGRKGSRK